jgi:hypothetical protein
VDSTGFAPPKEASHFLLGEPSDTMQLGLGPSLPKTDQMLLQIDSFATKDEEFNFGDTGTLCFFIKKSALEKKNFKKTWFAISSY